MASVPTDSNELAEPEGEGRWEAALETITAGLSAAATRDEILRSILDEGGRLLQASAAVAYLVSADRLRLAVVAHVGISQALAREVAGISVGSNFPVARSIREGRPVWVSSREALERDFPEFERAVAGQFERQAIAALPLRVGGEIIAGLGFAFPEAHAFEARERAFMTTLTERCEAALERARRYEESQQARAAAERSRAEAEALLRFNEVVAGILAHDLRNPLAAVLMNARLLGGAELERTRTIGTRIITSAERMSRMIDQILEWTRLRARTGRIELTCVDCDLGGLTDEVVAEVRARKPDAPIAVERRGVLRGRWDGDRLAQVVSNLVGNAVDHATGPGVLVALDGTGPRGGEGHGGEVTISVQNEGQIDDGLLPVIFEPFRRRVEGSRVPGRGPGRLGLGLGLYIARQIVLAHGGRLDVEQGPGPRVTFVATLPRAPG
jgi:signal transduction histidine kinase